MNISIGTTSDDAKVLNKSYNFSKSVEVTVKHPCDIFNPVFILAYDASLINANYVYCPKFNRYYFITEPPTLLTGRRMELHCTIDVLMSWQAGIKSVKTLVSRQEHAGLSTIPDSNIVIKNYDIINIYASDMSFDTSLGNYVLELYGG